uniref:C2H2-type domain-containing protein n=1 Tax=Trichobilharzia regenti TaxID=157069 RepID=A0AA85KCK7_TRIRE|nr:unnamed protein product [Trichobilharzia regenti]
MDIQVHDSKTLCQSLKRNIQLLESTSGCFTCFTCMHDKRTGNGYLNVSLKSGACTSDPEIFNAHLTDYHANIKSHLCLYCNSKIQRSSLVIHISQHLINGTSSKSLRIFSCPIENICSDKFCTNHFQHMKIHWETQHRDSMSTPVKLQCNQCMDDFPTLVEWGKHIKSYSRSLVHCTFPGCFVKSPSRTLLFDHIKLKHPKSLHPLVQVTSELICGHVSKTDSGSKTYSTSLSTDDHLPIVNRLCTDLSPPFVFLLRCPYCDLTTVRWNYFLMHPAACPGIKNFARNRRQESGSPLPMVYRCHIYWCSKCQVVSTEHKLLTEHVTYSHNPKEASVYREHLRVSLLDDNSRPITTDVSFKSEQHFEFSRDADDLIPFSITPEDGDVDTESPMNLAALAQPSASKLTSLTSRYQQTPLNNVPTGSPSKSSSSNNSMVVSTSLTSLPVNPPMNIINSADALKTLRSFAAGQNVGSITACDAASAVAAMAAAALSGFTNFNMNNTVSNSDSSFSSSLPCDISSPVPIQPKSSNLPAESIDPVESKEDLDDNDAKDSKCTDSLDSPAKSPDEYLSSDDSGRLCEGLVSFPFDECKFRSELSTEVQPHVIDLLVSKMRQFSSYFVRILGKENHRRIPACPECNKIFPYGLGDFKRHLLTVHLEVPREHLKHCLRFTFLPKSEEKFQEVQEQLVMRQMKPRVLEAGRRRIPLPYSIRILRRLIAHLPLITRDFLEQKMQLYSRLSVIVDTRAGFRRYKCNHCSYSSPHALADVRKHILGSHCGIPTKHFRHCLQASRLDPIEFTLFSDEKLARLARDFLHRREVSSSLNSPDASPNPVNSDNPRVVENNSTTSPATSNNSSGLSCEPHDPYVSHFTAVVPGSKTKVTVRIRPPIPPDFRPPESLTPTPSSTSHINGNSSSCPTLSSTSPVECGVENQTSSSDTNTDLTSLPSIPGIEGADRVVDLALPFSEPVLRHLLESSGALEHHIEDIVAKMRVYSTYKMSRICRNDRTIAFRCPCGRLFITTRQPDSKIRAATLADSRRHVMGVHARIPNVFITICCQASRITREYDFQIYPDDMLLRLAMDRPIKLSNLPPPPSDANGRSSSTNFVRPLKELAPYPPLSSIALQQSMNTNSVSSSPKTLTLDNGEMDSVSEGTDTGGTNSSIYHDDSFTKYENDDDKESSDNDPKRVIKEPEDPLAQLNAVQASGAEEVERIIDLPYSSEALKTLVQGYCPPNYFPILEAKMGVYSSLKVYITRRRGRRYFCCSGCSSSSPHGMGDIRKHILGVHAKVPERYKAAAMHCSRLSREDNTLLPNHVLLHLAKMKWKGTVIKPLSEMDLTQFGSRRASAVGLSRPPGQFASQVYQPIVHREVEKLVNTNRADHIPSSPSTYPMVKSVSQISTQDSELPHGNGTTNSSKPIDLSDNNGIDYQDSEVDNAATDNDEIELPKLPTNIFDNVLNFQLTDNMFDLSKPAKIPRLNDNTVVVYPLPVNGISVHQSHTNDSALPNVFPSVPVSSETIFETRSKPSIMLSGSSRRKPNKMQLVQLRPDHYSESNFTSIHPLSPVENSLVSVSSQQPNDTKLINSQVMDSNSNGIVAADCDHLTKVNHPSLNRIGV